MAEKAPGKPRKTTSSRKKETEQKTAQKTSTVTPIDQAGVHPTADQSGASTPTRANPASAGDPGAGSTPNPVARQGGSTPSVLNPRGSVQEGGHAAGVRQTRPDLDERIRHRAYELFEKRGRREGFHDEDWAQAEAEILAEFEREKSA
jgi:DUF2934 family protein